MSEACAAAQSFGGHAAFGGTAYASENFGGRTTSRYRTKKAKKAKSRASKKTKSLAAQKAASAPRSPKSHASDDPFNTASIHLRFGQRVHLHEAATRHNQSALVDADLDV